MSITYPAHDVVAAHRLSVRGTTIRWGRLWDTVGQHKGELSDSLASPK